MNEPAPLSPETRPADASPAQWEKSWGDRYKDGVFNNTLYVGLNYVFNAIASAALAYKLERNYAEGIRNFSGSVGEWSAKHLSFNARRMADSTTGSIQATILTSIGTLLIPVIRTAENHKYETEFTIGHDLDKLQETLGQGNAASKRNLAEYSAIRQALKTKTAPPASDATLDDWADRYHLATNDKGQIAFHEHTLPWLKVVSARVAGYLAVVASASALRFTRQNSNKLLNYTAYEEKAGNLINENIILKTPARHVISDGEHFARLLFTDAIYTMISDSAHCKVQHRLQREKKKKNASDGITPAPGSFAGREDAKTSGPQATALS